MRLSIASRSGNQTRRARPWIGPAGALALLSAAALTGTFLTSSSASAAPRSPCETGQNVGEVCHYAQVVSDGPDYDVKGYLALDSGQHLYDWNENNPDYTNWWYRYAQDSTPAGTMNLIINLRGNDNIGITRSWSPSEDHCFLITSDRKITERACSAG